MKKKLNWEKFQLKCKHQFPCDCGMSLLCEHNDSEDGCCDKEYCPLLKSKKR